MKEESIVDKILKIVNDKKTFGQFKRYLVVGISTFTIEYTLFRVFLDVLKFHYILSNVIVFAFIFWFNYLANRIWSFKSNTDIKKQLAQYAVLFTLNLIVPNFLIMYLLTDVVGIDPRISKVLIMGAVVSWNFIIYKKIIYK